MKAGYTPAMRDLGVLLDLLGCGDESFDKRAKKALLRLPANVEPLLLQCLAADAKGDTNQRSVWIRLLGNVASTLAATGSGSPLSIAALIKETHADDLKIRRHAFLALGRFPDEEVEAVLLEALTATDDVPTCRAIIKALGTAGGESALAALEALPAFADAELARICGEAKLILTRELTPRQGESIDAAAVPSRPLPIILHCRNGLEELVMQECKPGWQAQRVGTGAIKIQLRGPLTELFKVRTMSHFAFALPASAAAMDLAAATVNTLLAQETQNILATFSRGPIRYRLAWKGTGRQRSLLWRVAAAVTAANPQLVNTSRGADWQLEIRETARRGYSFELVPKGLADPRFVYRQSDVNAASHPTIAAALARVGGVDANDIVWDPFAGSGTELIERAYLGPYKALYATDLHQDVLEVADRNAKAAGVSLTLLHGDSFTSHPERVSLILTNPPLGRRIAPGEAEGLLLNFLPHAAALLIAGGRLVWISPQPEKTLKRAREVGFEVSSRQMIDLGGFSGELQAFVRLPQ